jgi:hypothetical protein
MASMDAVLSGMNILTALNGNNDNGSGSAAQKKENQ